MLRQSKLESAVEAVLNVGSGFVIALFAWQFIVAPLYGYKVTMLDNLGLTSIFTIISVVRGYVWRRFFERRIRRRLRGHGSRR
jgi:membrane protein implicated in regulation of membrane protease activity